RLNKLEAALSYGSSDLKEAVSLIAYLLSIPTGDRYPTLALTPQKRKEKTLAALISQIENHSVKEPALIVFEDVHWSDHSTRQPLDLLIDRLPKQRMVLTIPFRPDFVPPWIGRPNVTSLNLDRLPPQQRAEMIAHMTAGRTLPNQIIDQIIDRTDG